MNDSLAVRIRSSYKKLMSLLLASVLVFLVSCSSGASVHELSLYGTYGRDIALQIARNYPRRAAGSGSASATADLIQNEFEAMGYTTESQSFSLAADGSSRNIMVRIPGTGFLAESEDQEALDYEIYGNRADASEGIFSRQVIIGARYDTDPAAAETADGISDNASGVAALLVLAKQLKLQNMGYDVVLVAFGGGFAGSAGANAFVDSLSENELAQTDAFYEFRSLYGGAKLYANAGWSSLYPNKKYLLRQPLYGVATIALSEQVLGRSGVALYQNQSTFMIPNPLSGETAPAPDYEAVPAQVAFREISTTQSDYRVFDREGIPCVLIESTDFNAPTFEELKENADPNYSSTGYTVRGTEFDRIAILGGFSDPDLLENRINVSAFLVYKAIEEGVLGSIQN